jgi:hypothetical protein
MNNQELMKLAAKGAGIELEPTSEGYPLYIPMWGIWNPLEDDGDALRLAVKLDMVLLINRVDEWTDVEFGYSVKDVRRLREGHGSNPYAATRRAIVRAAAEIGKQVSA